MSDSKRYICFGLGQEEFAIPLLSVREVLGMPETTPVPQTPAHFLGIMNLRGKIISVLDLRLKLGIKPSPQSETAVIILDMDGSQMGIVVDQVNSVQEIGPNNFSQKPSLDNSKANEYVEGVFKNEEKLILLLDISRAISNEDRKVASQPKAA